jgi:hypothetical protein
MASTFIIRKVTEAILGILRNDLAGITASPATTIRAGRPESASGELPAGNETLLLYLYQVVESPFLKNVGPKAEPVTGGGIRVRKDPLALELYYLIIPAASDNGFLETYDILGAAMRSLHDHGIFSLGDWVPPDSAMPPLTDAEAKLQVHVDFNRLETADLIRIWEAVHAPYRLSVSYVVRTLQIDSQLTTGGGRVTSRNFDFEQQ